MTQLKLWREEPEQSEEPTKEQLATWLQQSQEQFERLAWAHRDVMGRLQQLEPVFERLYKKRWLRILYLPVDPKREGRQLMRCRTCGGLFWEGGPKEYTTHMGHKYSVATEGTWWEGLVLKLGMIK